MLSRLAWRGKSAGLIHCRAQLIPAYRLAGELWNASSLQPPVDRPGWKDDATMETRGSSKVTQFFEACYDQAEILDCAIRNGKDAIYKALIRLRHPPLTNYSSPLSMKLTIQCGRC